MIKTVLGIDVGYSTTRKTTGFCALSWDDKTINWHCHNTGRDDNTRLKALHAILPSPAHPILAVALDGPLRPNLLEDATQYRAAECLLSSGRFQKRGKPGATNSGSGPQLHLETTLLARFALQHLNIEPADTPLIHPQAIVEAFPNLFLGVLHDEADYPLYPTVKRKWTDTLYPKLRDKLALLLHSLLPGRTIIGTWPTNDHEEIAALVCALTALCFLTDHFTAVGSPADGYIILPPRSHWGTAVGGSPLPWAERELQQTLLRPDTIGRFPNAGYW